MQIWNSCFDRARRKVSGVGFDPELDGQYKMVVTKYHLQHPELPFESWEVKDFGRLLDLHYQLLAQQGYVDFDIIIKSALSLITDHDLVRQSLFSRFAWLAIDEYQDLGYPLFRIVAKMLELTTMKLFAIGDPDQSIFDFAGTNPRYLLALAENPDMQPIVKLDINYRATTEIIAISKTILKPYCDYSSSKRGGACHIYETLPYDQGKLAATLAQEYLQQGVPKQRLAILHNRRISKDGRIGINCVADDLQAAGIDFTLDKNPYYDRRMNLIKWLEGLGYWCLHGWHVQMQGDQLSFDELAANWHKMSYPQTSMVERIGSVRSTLARLIDEGQGTDLRLNDWLFTVSTKLDFSGNLVEYESLYPDELIEFRNLLQLTQREGELRDWRLSDFVNLTQGVQLTTLHSSKGMEFEVVIIAGVERIWDDVNGQRLLYVGATRAEREICLIYSKVWPKWSPRTPAYIQNLLKHCNHLDYFYYHPLQ